jgi:hypothetical protein
MAPTSTNANHSAFPQNADFHHFNDGRMDASPPTRELKTKVGYQKKRKMMVYPMVLAAAVKFYHGHQQDNKGISLFVWDISGKKSETIVLETVVSRIEKELMPTYIEPSDSFEKKKK